MISQTAEYALRAIVCLADHPDGFLTTSQVAKRTKVPAGYLSKVLQSLGRAGLVRSTRGIGGGFVLGRPATEISVLNTVNAVDPIKRIHSCPLGLDSHGAHLCALHRRLDDAAESVEQAFAESTIAELLAKPTRSHPLCETPQRGRPPRGARSKLSAVRFRPPGTE
ncbi:MAG: HTH-type transcriptional repressor NsrR [Phycisphaerae bacterium]|nr:HTH-type transcriptional repressor NsrR [Phycisphaerae bacterium]